MKAAGTFTELSGRLKKGRVPKRKNGAKTNQTPNNNENNK
jgi:hypothetical protein